MLQKAQHIFGLVVGESCRAVNSQTGARYNQRTGILRHSPRQPSQDSLITR